jgi:hypothetical protein
MSSVLNKMDYDLSRAAEKLSISGIQGSAARKILSELGTQHPYVVDCATIDKNGKEVEAFTKDDIDKVVEEAVSKAIDDTNTERQAEIDELTAKVSGGADDKSKNLVNQRKIIKDKDDTLAKMKARIDEFEAKMAQSQSAQKVDSIIKSVAGDDPDMNLKVKTFYDSFKGEPADDEQINQRVQNAFKLAGGGDKPSLSSEMISSGGGVLPQDLKINAEKLPAEAVEVAHQMGVTDQELSEHNLT